MSKLRNSETQLSSELSGINLPIPNTIPKPWADVLLNGGSFEDLVKDHGMLFTLYRAAPCPNFISNTNQHRDDCENPLCSDGQIYFKHPEPMYVVITGSGGGKNFEAGGSWDKYMARGIFPATDAAGNSVTIGIMDKIVPVDDSIIAVTYQTIEINYSSISKAKYPIVNIEFFMDAQGNEYKCGEHFNIVNGKIQWIENKKPPFDAATRKGPILSIRYTYKPYFIVSEAMSADLRIHVGVDPYTFEKKTLRLPASFTLYREFHQPDPKDKDGDSTTGPKLNDGRKNILPT